MVKRGIFSNIDFTDRAFLRQLLATLSCNLSSTWAACCFMWLEPLRLWLIDELKITPTDISWLTAFIELAGLMFGLPLSMLADRYGRKTTLLLCLPLCILGWILAYFTRSLFILYIIRGLQGTCLAIVYTVAPMYVAEISSPNVRGYMNGIFSVMWYIGTTYVYTVGHNKYTAYSNYIICLSYPAILFLTFVLVPESPYYYILKDDKTNAAKSLAWFRAGQNFEHELQSMQYAVQIDKKNGSCWIELFKTSTDRKSLFIVQIVALVRYMSGISTISCFVSDIFSRGRGQILTPDQLAVAVGVVQLVSTFSSIFFSDSIGRKSLLLWSTIACTIANLINTLYFFIIEKTSLNIEQFVWIMYLGITCFCIFSSAGYGHLMLTIQSEIFRTKTRCIGSAVTNIFAFVYVFISLSLYQIIIDNIGIYMNFLMFAIISLIGLIMVAIYVPESANKTLEEVTEEITEVKLKLLEDVDDEI